MRLRCWEDADRDAFATLHAHPEVVLDDGGPLDREQSNTKLDRSWRRSTNGFSSWAVETLEGEFLGYAGGYAVAAGSPARPTRRDWLAVGTVRVGARLRHRSRRGCLHDVFARGGLTEVLAYNAPDNLRSQAVMTRLSLSRDPSRDFSE